MILWSANHSVYIHLYPKSKTASIHEHRSITVNSIVHNTLANWPINAKREVQSREERLPISYFCLTCEYYLTGFFISRIILLFPISYSKNFIWLPCNEGPLFIFIEPEWWDHRSDGIFTSFFLFDSFTSFHPLSVKQKKAALLSWDFFLAYGYTYT